MNQDVLPRFELRDIHECLPTGQRLQPSAKNVRRVAYVQRDFPLWPFARTLEHNVIWFVKDTGGRGSSVTAFLPPDAALSAFRYNVPA